MVPLSRAPGTAAIVALLAATPVAAQVQSPSVETIPIGAIDFYGLRTLSDSTVRRVLGIAPGAPVPDSTSRAAAVERVKAMPNVRDVRMSGVCCAESGGILLYVGIEEVGAPTLRFRPAPAGSVRLPAEVLAAGRAFDDAFAEAIEHGDFAETDTAGHAIMHWPAARAAQLRFIDLAAQFTDELRDVLRNSADPEQRALAAQVLGYSPDKGAIVPELSSALRDQDDVVRNNATRALALIALLAQRHPELGIQVPHVALLDLLESPIWTDRNKASLVLAQLTATRDPDLIAALRERSLPALLEMARWRELGHAGPALTILGRLAGMPEREISEALQAGDRDVILRTAERISDRAP